ncbi:antibiotic biosynthesis regulator FhaA [Pedococcus ginsenosidimutans]|uniref:Antibiotic biosynthesis regulator FhaA n=1 Tax=Pedococcus ginsenosidimutans TaxID=490570 RepID=A0ABP8XTP2_9MICO
MGLFDRVEQRLERAVNGAFARAFKSEVQPVEIASAIRRAMDDRAAILGPGRTIVPNLYTVELSDTDYDRLGGYDEELENELIAAAQEHAESQRYQPGGPLQVSFASANDLETGVFRLRTSTARRPGDVSGRRDDGRRDDSQRDQPRSAGLPAAAAPQPVPAPVPPPVPAARHVDDDGLEATQAQAPVAPPAPPRRVNPADRPWLDVDGERYPLMGAITVLGRDDAADIVLDDPGISRRHSEIRVTNDGPHLVASIRDLGSTNGTFVNSERISSQRLSDGDRVTVGRTSVVYRAGKR